MIPLVRIAARLIALWCRPLALRVLSTRRLVALNLLLPFLIGRLPGLLGLVNILLFRLSLLLILLGLLPRLLVRLPSRVLLAGVLLNSFLILLLLIVGF